MRYVLLIFLFIASFKLEAQNLMQQRPNLNWKKISSENFDIIYPEKNASIAKRVVSLLEYYRSDVSEDYQVATDKLTLILHDKTSDSNGFVTLGPRRSEWYMTPSLSRELGSSEWYNTLAIHEFRHVVQFQKMHAGFNRALYYLLGDTGLSLGIMLSAPSWYFEGDAVVAETALSKAGRGRSAGFSQIMRSILLDEKEIDYETLFMPNYNHILPYSYEYGYFLNAYLRNEYGPRRVSLLIEESIRDSYWPFTYYNSYPLAIDKKFMDYHKETLLKMHHKLQEEEKGNRYTKGQTLLEVKKEKGFTSIDQFKVTKDGIYLLKQDFDDIMALYLLDKEKKLHHIRDLHYLPYTQRASFSATHLLYTQMQPAMRYLFESSSDLYLMDLKTGAQKKLTEGKIIFHPTFSHDEKSLFTIEQNDKSNFDLVERSREGEELRRFQFDNVYPSYPQSKDKDSLYLILQKMDGKKAIVLFDLNQKTYTEITPYSWNQLSHLRLIEEDLYYERDYKGKIEIMRLDTDTKKEYLMTSSRVGARSVDLYHEALYYLNYTRYGYELKKTTISENKLLSVNDIEKSNHNKLATDLIKESKDIPQEKDLNTDFVLNDFSRFKNLFNFHSWLLLPLPGSITLQATSNNYLNTIALTAGYTYSDFEEANSLFASFHYMRYWPILSVETSWGQRRTFEDDDHKVREDAWDETIVQGLVSLPFILNFNTFSQSLIFSGGWSLIETSGRQDNHSYEPKNNTLAGPTFQANYELTKNMARRDINPRYGLKLKTLNRKVESARGDELKGHQDIYSASFFIPGFFKHNSIMLSASQETQKSFTDYRFESLIKKARTTAYDFVPKLETLTFDYFFPLAYPDLSFSRWYYLSRVYASVFYDYAELEADNALELRSSAGLDIYFESRFLRLLPITFGLRVAQKLHEGESAGELFLKTDVSF